MLQGVIFDFDGLILDTESTDFQSWQETYTLHGGSLELTTWLPFIGMGRSSNAQNPFNPYELLEAQLGRSINRDEVGAQRRNIHLELVASLPLLPGVEATILEAKKRHLKLAVASSSARAWVVGHLTRRQLLHYFDCVICGDEVQYTKPYPDVYLSALSKLGLDAKQTIALEDSSHGVHAAKQAGIFCIAIPGPLTQNASFDHADIRLSSLADLSFEDLLAHF